VLSRQQRWDDMERLIDDEMLHTIAVIGTYDTIPDAVLARYGGLCDTVEFSIPVAGPADRERLADIVAAIQRGPA
jgi:hypothetical protein